MTTAARHMIARLSYFVDHSRHCLTKANERSTTLRFREAPVSNVGGRPLLLPRLFRVAIWTLFLGSTARASHERRSSRLTLDVYVRSARTASSQVRGRPPSARGTRTSARARTKSLRCAVAHQWPPRLEVCPCHRWCS